MKVLITHPKVGSAIERLSSANVKYTPHHEFRMVEVHPKRPDPIQLDKFTEAYEWCDVWDAQYWKTSEKLREIFGDRLNSKPAILTHHNPYDLLAREWDYYQEIVVMNRTQKKDLPGSIHIPHAIDFEMFTWNPNYTDEKSVIMVAQRIEGSKGIEPVARACHELGYRFYLVGQISDAEYFRNLLQYKPIFMENIPDEELIEMYHRSAIHVCNSKDNFESGTMPILEAMAVGVPVITRRIGHIPDIATDKNMIVRDGQPDDYEELRIKIKSLMENREQRLQMREEAWHTVRNMDVERRARRYSQLYNKVVFGNKPLVSVVLPVFGRPDSLQANIDAINAQTYEAIEIVIVSDGDEAYDQLLIKSDRTVKYFRVGDKDKYGLGFARDYGVMEAEGEIIVFMDERFIPEPNVIKEFLKELRPKRWLYGNKNGKRTFVENVSCLYRQEFIDMGMSNQLIDAYGGMSQELRERSKKQGVKHVFVEKAIANPQFSSHNYNKKKDEIRRMKDRLWKLGL